jgi:hypothetical protein
MGWVVGLALWARHELKHWTQTTQRLGCMFVGEDVSAWDGGGAGETRPRPEGDVT